MQTFLPYPDFITSAKVLDSQRLGKQRVECKQMVTALEAANTAWPSKGWIHHPATKMWEGYIPALAQYGAVVCEEWISRGYKDSLLPFFRERAKHGVDYLKPTWLGNEEFHLSHRSNLLRKRPEYYRTFWPSDPDDLLYIWPKPGDK